MTKYNAPFDPRILEVSGPNWSDAGNLTSTITLQRGKIISDDSKFGVNFLYNPSQIILQHNTENASYEPAQGLLNADSLGLNNLAGLGTLSFSLLFDRTYEMWSVPGNVGVLEDVAAFYRVSQMLDDGPSFNPTKPMNVVPVNVYFGKPPILTILSYYGWLSTLTITYTHWNAVMVPMRCAIDVTVTLLQRPAPATPAPPAPGAPPAGPTAPPIPPGDNPATPNVPSGGGLPDTGGID